MKKYIFCGISPSISSCIATSSSFLHRLTSYWIVIRFFKLFNFIERNFRHFVVFYTVLNWWIIGFCWFVHFAVGPCISQPIFISHSFFNTLNFPTLKTLKSLNCSLTQSLNIYGQFLHATLKMNLTLERYLQLISQLLYQRTCVLPTSRFPLLETDPTTVLVISFVILLKIWSISPEELVSDSETSVSTLCLVLLWVIATVLNTTAATLLVSYTELANRPTFDMAVSAILAAKWVWSCAPKIPLETSISMILGKHNVNAATYGRVRRWYLADGTQCIRSF